MTDVDLEVDDPPARLADLDLAHLLAGLVALGPTTTARALHLGTTVHHQLAQAIYTGRRWMATNEALAETHHHLAPQDVADLARWIEGAAADFLSLNRMLDTTRPRPQAPAGGGLLIDADLDGLPLLDLAADLHRTSPHRLHTIAVNETLTTTLDAAGLYWAGRIELDPADGNLEATFAHELGHAIDSDYAEATPLTREAFAETMAVLLLRHQPATITAAAPLIAEARRAKPPTRLPGLPGPGIDSVLAYVALPIDPAVVVARLEAITTSLRTIATRP